MKCTQPYARCRCRSLPNHLAKNASITDGRDVLTAHLAEMGYQMSKGSLKYRVLSRAVKMELWVRGR